MVNPLTRSGLLQVWLLTVVLIVVGGVALGTTLTLGTGAVLLGACVVPPVLILTLCPRAPVLHDGEVRPWTRLPSSST